MVCLTLIGGKPMRVIYWSSACKVTLLIQPSSKLAFFFLCQALGTDPEDLDCIGHTYIKIIGIFHYVYYLENYSNGFRAQWVRLMLWLKCENWSVALNFYA